MVPHINYNFVVWEIDYNFVSLTRSYCVLQWYCTHYYWSGRKHLLLSALYSLYCNRMPHRVVLQEFYSVWLYSTTHAFCLNVLVTLYHYTKFVFSQCNIAPNPYLGRIVSYDKGSEAELMWHLPSMEHVVNKMRLKRLTPTFFSKTGKIDNGMNMITQVWITTLLCVDWMIQYGFQVYVTFKQARL